MRQRALALRYALAPACILLAGLLHLSPVGATFHPTGLFTLAVVAAAWFGGAGPGFLAAVLATFMLPQLIAMSYSLVGGVFDLPRFVTFSVAGLAVGWWSFRRRQVEAARRVSEERHARAMEASAAGHWDWNMLTDELFVSERAREMFELPPGQLPPTRAEFLSLMSKYRADMDAGVEDSMRSGTFDRVYRVVLQTGAVRWLNSRGKVYRDAAGTPLRMAGSVTDITERRRVEEALRASEERISLAMEASEEGYIDCDVQTDRFITSERMREIFEVPPGTRIAYRRDFNEQFRFYSDEDAKVYGDAMRTVSAQGGPDRYEFEFRVVLPSGKVKWIWTRSKVTRDAEGRALRRVGVVADVTARKLAEQALRESEDRFARAVAGSSDGVWDIDFVGRTVYFSPRTRELCGLPPGPEVVPLDGWFEALPLHPEDRAKRSAAVEAHLSGKVPAYEGEFRIRQRDGVYRWRRLHGKCVRDAGGKPLRMAGSISDIDARRRAEDALRESEARYERVVTATEAGFWDWDITRDKYYVSPRLLEMAGLPPGTLIAGRADFMARVPWHPEDLAKWQREMQALFASGESRLSTELRLMLATGARWVRLDGMCFRDAAGAVLRWTGSAIDVTPRKHAEQALRESEERYERAVDASDDGFWDWIPAGDRIYASRRLREIYGIAPDAALAGRADFMARIPFHPEERTRLTQGFAEHLAGQESRYKIEARILRDGETRWVQIAGLAVRDASGVLVHWTGTVRDITELKRAEKALRESEQSYELAMAASESGYWDWHIPTNRYFASPRALELAGFPPGTTWVTRDQYRANINMHPEDFARWEAEREALFAGTGERLSMEVRYVVGGENRWHLLHAICRRDAAGKVVRWGGSSTDITERKKGEEELRRMERKLRQAQRLEAMGTLAGGIAHDFNNILGAMLAYGEMAQRDAPDGSRLARDLSKIMTAGERGRALVDRVLTFSRSAVSERVPVHVERVVREVLDLIMAKLPPNVTVHPKLHGASAAVLADATQVHQLVSNLATNGIQAMPAGGTLRVALAIERVEVPRTAMIGGCGTGDYVVVTVADSGAGIAPEILERIFDPYFTTKDVGTGTGLGLSLVHGIVTGLGGAIDVASTPGAGSTFTIYLPRCGDAAEPRDERQSGLPRGEGQRVLIVDDEEAMVELATRTLENLGYVPTGFTSSTAALAAFRADPERFDAVITDERMPGVSGSALIREVRGMRGRLPIVLMSGYLGGGLAERAREAGVDEVLKKPVSAHDVASGLARALQNSAVRRVSPGPGPASARGS